MYNGAEYKSECIDYVGVEPKWNQSYIFEVKGADKTLTIRLRGYDKKTGNVVGLGHTEIELTKLCDNGLNCWFDIKLDDKLSGKLRIETRFQQKDGEEIDELKILMLKQNQRIAKINAESRQLQHQSL